MAPPGLISAPSWGNARDVTPCAWEAISELEIAHGLEAGRGVNLSDPFLWDDAGTATAAAGAVITVISEPLVGAGQGAKLSTCYIYLYSYI